MKNAVITILAILVLGLGGYLVYDKIIDKQEEKKCISEEENSISNTDNQDENEESFSFKKLKKNATYGELQQYLKYFFPTSFAGIEYRSNKDIDNDFVTDFVYYTINYLRWHKEIEYNNVEDNSIIVNKKYVDNLISTYFDGNYSINVLSSSDSSFGIHEYDENNYKFSYKATGWYPDRPLLDDSKDEIYLSDDNTISIGYLMVSDMSAEITGTLKFYLKYVDDTYKVTKVEFTEKE